MKPGSYFALHSSQLLVTVLLCLLVVFAQAQDTLYYTNGNQIVGKVEEVGTDQVSYRANTGGSEVKVVVKKMELARIVFQNGQQLDFDTNKDGIAPTGNAYYNKHEPDPTDKKHAFKVDFISPTLNHFVIGYEQVVGDRINIEFKLGYIGLETKTREYLYNYENTQGYMAKVGIKFLHHPERYHEQALTGWYLKPELMYSRWTGMRLESNYAPYPYHLTWTEVKYTVSSVALNLVIGRQVLLGRRVTLDLFGGLGYGFQNIGTSPSFNNDKFHAYSYSHLQVNQYIPLAMSGGLLFGYAF